MPVHVKDGGTWRESSGIHVKDGGTWRDIQEGHIKDGGTWRQWHSGVNTLTITCNGGSPSGSGGRNYCTWDVAGGVTFYHSTGGPGR